MPEIIEVKEYSWETVIDAIVGLEGTGVLGGTTLRIRSGEPSEAGETIGPPIIFPRDDPFIEMDEVTTRTYSGGKGNTRTPLRMSQYRMHWIYQHIEDTQGLDINQYRSIIRRNIALLFDEITAQQSNLGVLRVRPLTATIDTKLKSEITGKNFIGAMFTLVCREFIHHRTS